MSDEETLKRAVQQIDALWSTYRGLGGGDWRGVPAWALEAVMKAARKQLEPRLLPWVPIEAWLEAIDG